MSYSEIWNSNESWWSYGLELLTLEWARPIFDRMGIPSALVKQPEIAASIYVNIWSEYKRRQLLKDWEVGTIKGANKLWQEVVTVAFQQLAEQTDRHIAMEIESWVIRHFLWREFQTAMHAWSYVLYIGCLYPDDYYPERQIPPPAVLTPLFPEIIPLIFPEEKEEFEEVLKQIAPPRAEDESLLSMCGDAVTIRRIVEDESVVKALRIIASKLDEAGRAEVTQWALLQAAKLTDSIEPEELQGDKYLRVEPPCSDFPSVLDSPISDAAGSNNNPES
ncbi:hypothetical protein NIES4074_52150 [Cylindrospermum sp. NIES-4074]|nr:hypothetical protein NIES4074_52150 [Cylindrospermum sp. NIES-4074]